MLVSCRALCNLYPRFSFYGVRLKVSDKMSFRMSPVLRKSDDVLTQSANKFLPLFIIASQFLLSVKLFAAESQPQLTF